MRTGGEDARPRLLAFGINYAPEPTGTALNTTWLLEQLAACGWETSIVTGVPHYPAWRRGPAPAEEHRAGVAVRRRTHYVPSHQTALRRGIYEATWVLSALPEVFRRRRPHVVLGVVPSLGGAVLAQAAARRFGVPHALLFQDVIGRAASQSGMPGASRVAERVRAVETALARRAQRVAVVADGFREYFIEGGVDAARIVRVRNPARLGSPTESREETRARLGWKPTHFVVLHTGSMGYKQGLDSVIDAAALARDDETLRFVLQGDGNQRAHLEAMVRRLALENVDFLPLAPEDEFPNILRAADALVLNQRDSVRNMSMPAKLASYFLAGVPTIAAVARGDETAREVEAAGGGIIAEPGRPDDLLRAVTELRRDPDRARELGTSARRFADAVLTEEAVIGDFEMFLHAAMEDAHPDHSIVRRSV